MVLLVLVLRLRLWLLLLFLLTQDLAGPSEVEAHAVADMGLSAARVADIRSSACAAAGHCCRCCCCCRC